MASRPVVEIGQDIATILTESYSSPADFEPVDVNPDEDLDDDGSSSIEALHWSDFDDEELEQARLNVPSDNSEIKEMDVKADDSLNPVENGESEEESEDDLQVSTTSTVNEGQLEQPQTAEDHQEVEATPEKIDDTSCDASVESAEVEETQLLEILKEEDKIYRFEKNRGFNEKLTFGVIVTVVLAAGIGIGNFVAYTEYEEMMQVPEYVKAYGQQSGINSSSSQPVAESGKNQNYECLATDKDVTLLAQHIQLLKSCNATLGHVVEQLDSLQHRIDSLGTNRAQRWFPFSISRSRDMVLKATSKQEQQPNISKPVEDLEEVTVTEAPFEMTRPKESLLDNFQKTQKPVHGAISFGAIASDKGKALIEESKTSADFKAAPASEILSEVVDEQRGKSHKKNRKAKSKSQKSDKKKRSEQDANQIFDILPKEAKKVLKKQKNFDNDMKNHLPMKQDSKKKQQKIVPADDELIQPCHKRQKSKDRSCSAPEMKRKKKNQAESAPQPQAAEFDWHVYRAKTREHRRMQNVWESEFKQQQVNWQLDRARSREMQRNQVIENKKFKKMSKKAYNRSKN